MHPIIVSSEAQVGPIVHDERDIPSQDTANFTRMAQHPARIAIFVAILEKRHSPGGQVHSEISHCRRCATSRREAGHVEDGIKPGQLDGP
jgi:hypothetical protein